VNKDDIKKSYQRYSPRENMKRWYIFFYELILYRGT
jgi:hypothetical protein